MPQELAHYSVIEKIGEGGMGEVYRAHDTRLGRDVALKFLPDSLATDTERLARFEREAKLLASLNHPHIAAIHGFEHVNGKRFLVLEMVEGEDVARRLARGAIGWQEALALCRQIAEALETAHEEGIVHRDLKPANVQLTPDGTVKVLDFGLAKAWESETTNANLSNSPTVMASSPTVAGVILGTAAYMSPEQARGQTVDKRADIFAFGCVLYEMLTAKQCFTGDTLSDTLAAVLRADPDWDALPKDMPHAITRLLGRCLDKDPKQRLRDIGEARIMIDSILRGDAADEASVEAPAAATPQKRTGAMTAWIVAGVLAITTAVCAIAFLQKSPEPTPVLRTSILPPEKVRFNLRGIHPGPVVISPQGERVVYTGRAAGGASLLYVRELEAVDSRALPGTDDAGYPFWSPDGRSVGFFAGGKLKRIDIAGGPPLTLCEAPVGKGGGWNRDGTIVFAPSFNTVLHRVSDVGGRSTPITDLRTDEGENSHRFPQFLPDGDRLIYFARVGSEASVIRTASLSGGEDKEILRANSNAVYASGHLLFLRQTTLMAQPFDPAKLEFTGDPAPIADPVRFIPAAMCGIFDASENGMLVYQSGLSIPGAQLVWRDLSGKELGRLGDIVQQDSPRVSPDGKFVAVDVFDLAGGTGDIWIFDVGRGVRTRFTFDPASDEDAVWSPDANRIAFASGRDNRSQLFIKNVGGASNEEPLIETEGLAFATDWTRDGRFIVYFVNDSTNTGNIWAVPADGAGEPFQVVGTKYGEYNGTVSGDGNWIAYISDESGSFEVYVTSFPAAGRKWQISSGGGFQPNWDPSGRGIYYFGADNTFYFVKTEQDANMFAIGKTTPLFESNAEISYDLTPDGERLLILEDADEGSIWPLTLVTSWVSDLESRQRR
ncbi:MAG: protein kinase [Candidatus Krumholzibacteria bacterium]|nr:protein kinase [Candidatus Krumholzibacteria bacterium]